MPALRRKAIAALLFVGLLALGGGSSPFAAAQPAGAAPEEMVSVIVALKDQATLAGLNGTTRRIRLERVVRALQRKADRAQAKPRIALEAGRRQGSVQEYRSFWILNAFEVTATRAFLARLARRSDVLKITPNATIQAPASDPTASTPEANVALVGAPDLWSLGYTGNGIVVASMDTGVQATHPDLSAQWRGGTNSWFDPNGQHPSAPIDLSGHGTRTMGVMVGRAGGGTAVGVAPDAKWIAVKIFNDAGSATTAGIHAGFQWLLDPDGDPATADAPHVVNNSWSLSSPGCNLEFQLDLQALRAANIVPVFAAGNYGPLGSTSRSPANNPEALAVGATTKTDGIWTYSSRGPSGCADTDVTYPEVVAPGAGIRTTDRFNGYVNASGTSLAAPHVTGAFALQLDAHAGATPTQLEAALESTGFDLGPAGPDTTYGYGRLNALAAYNWLGAPPPEYALDASPSVANADQGGSASYVVSVTPQGGFDGDVALSVSGLPTDAGANFTPSAVSGGSGSSLLTVSTAGSTPAGSYPLTVTATSGSLSHAAQVTLIVDPPPDFTVSASPSSTSTVAGGTVSYTTTVGSVNGFGDDVALSVSGLPAGATASFDPPTVAGGSGAAQLTVTTAGTTATGSSTLTVTGTSGSLERTTSVTLMVTPPDVTAFPDTTTIQTGTLRAGLAASLSADDAHFYELNSSNRVTAWYGSFQGVPNDLASMRITYKGKNSRSCVQTLAVRSWTAGGWVQLDSRNVGATEVLIADLIPPGAPADYVSGESGDGELRVRARCAVTSGSFFASGNLMRVVYTRP